MERPRRAEPFSDTASLVLWRAMRVAGADLLSRARPVVDAAIGNVCTACVLRVERDGEARTYAAGTLEPGADDALCVEESLFDLASLTKLATTALVLTYVRDGALALGTPLAELAPEFADSRVTLEQVLTHTAGLAWWRHFYKEASGLDEIVRLAAREPLAYPPGRGYAYSDLGYIMLTAGLARIGGKPFRDLLEERVLRPLGIETLRYGPVDRARCAATELDGVWRQRRLRGEVHDENAFAMGGVAGQAGLFGTAADVAALARVYRDGALVGADLAREATRERAVGPNARRGLGVALKAPDGAMCGRHFSPSSFGHSGFTGTSLWVDPQRELTVVLLTNAVYFGRDDEPIYRFRVAVHEAVSAP